MIRHIVMWKYNGELSLEEREDVFERLKKSADNMRGNIEGLLSIELIKNKNPKEKHDLCLYCEFDNIERVDFYQVHPLHLAFKDIITGNVIDRVCIDG